MLILIIMTFSHVKLFFTHCIDDTVWTSDGAVPTITKTTISCSGVRAAIPAIHSYSIIQEILDCTLTGMH